MFAQEHCLKKKNSFKNPTKCTVWANIDGVCIAFSPDLCLFSPLDGAKAKFYLDKNCTAKLIWWSGR